MLQDVKEFTITYWAATMLLSFPRRACLARSPQYKTRLVAECSRSAEGPVLALLVLTRCAAPAWARAW